MRSDEKPGVKASGDQEAPKHNENDAYDYQHHQNPSEDENNDAIPYKRDQEPECFKADGDLPERVKRGGAAEFWNDHGSHKPSTGMEMSSEKAKTILHDGSVRGHPLSPKQKGLFGAIAGKGKK